MENFGKVYLEKGSNKNYKAIGYAFSIPCGDGDNEAEVEFFNEEDEDMFDAYKSDLYDKAHNYTKCNHCGARMKYCIIVKDVDLNTIHVVGRDCGDTIRDFGIVANRLADKSAKAMKIAQNKKNRKNFLEKHKGLEEALNVKGNKLISDIRLQFIKYETLSQKQIDLVFKLAEKQNEINSERETNGKPIDFKKLKNVELIVVSVKKPTKITDGNVFRITLKSSDGWVINGNLENKYIVENESLINKGDNVLFSSNKITVSSGDKYFGFFSRGTIQKIENIFDKKIKLLNLMLASADENQKDLIEKKIRLLKIMK